MNCKYCGSVIMDGADFCTNCGKQVTKEDHPVVMETVARSAAVVHCRHCGSTLPENAEFCTNCGQRVTKEDCPVVTIPDDHAVPEKRKNRAPAKVFIGISVVAILAILGNVAYQQIMKYIITQYTDAVFAYVKTGPSEAEMSELLSELIYSATGNKTVTSFVKQTVSGEDVLDVYHAVMEHMEYQVEDVVRVERGHYKVIVNIQNVNNITAAKNAILAYKDKYENKGILGKLFQAVTDVTSDKSKLIAGYLVAASNDLYTTGDYVTNTVSVDVVNAEDGWEPLLTEATFMQLVQACAGIR